MKEAILRALTGRQEGVSTSDLERAVGVGPGALADVLEELKATERVLSFAGLWFTPEAFEEGTKWFLDALNRVHLASPSDGLVDRHTVANEGGFKWVGKPFDRMVSLWESRGLVRSRGILIGASDFRPALKAKQRALLDRVVEVLKETSPDVPGAYELANHLGVPRQAVEGILEIGVDGGFLIDVGEGIFYDFASWEALAEKLWSEVGNRGFTVGDARDFWKTSRRYAVALVESFERAGMTVREDDEHRFLSRD